MPKFVEAVAKSTGKTQIIPEHWVDHPVLGSDFKVSKEIKEQAAPSRTARTTSQTDKES
jgi:hypothetical protein